MAGIDVYLVVELNRFAVGVLFFLILLLDLSSDASLSSFLSDSLY